MAYFQPYIDTTGIHIPTYQDIVGQIVSDMNNIFGTDIYLDNDSMDYQQISIFAKMIYDTYCLAQVIYNNRTVQNSIGTGLDEIVAYNGVKRKEGTKSTVHVVLTGAPGTIITNGKVSDQDLLVTWLLPEEVTIGENGSIEVQARSEENGEYYYLPNTITKIVTPVFGWISVTNTESSSPGTETQTDAELKAVFANSITLPSLSIFDGIVSGLQNLEGVRKVAGYENDTNTQNELGHPAHSITMVVDGGEDSDIASTIHLKKTPGCYTNGDVVVNVTTDIGSTIPIRFYRAEKVNLYMTVNIKTFSSYSSDYETLIKNSLVEYIDEIEIGEHIYNSMLLMTAQGVVSSSINSLPYVVTSVKVGKQISSQSTSDIILSFKEMAVTSFDNISVVIQS